MSRLWRAKSTGQLLAVVAAFGGLLLCTACAPGNAFFQQGRKAELRKDWDTALINYQKAAQTQPENAKFLLEERHARMEAGLFHVQQGKQLLKDGRPTKALGEFQKAVSIDPSNQAAQQELTRLVKMQAAAKRAHQKAIETAIISSEKTALPPPVELKRLPQEPLTQFRISADSKRVYETLGKLAGLNVVFTSDFQAKPVSLDLNDVKLSAALHVLSLQTHTFWKVVTPNTILVVPDNPANRRDYQTQVLKTVYLENPLKPAERTAITTALKQILGLQRIIDNPDANAIIIRDTPKKVREATDLIHDLDRGKAEIMIDVTVLEADADRVRDLGLSPATVNAASGSITNGIQGGAIYSPSATTSLSHISTADFGLVVPSAVASAILSDSTTQILQNPEVRVTDGDTAKLQIGSRIPYATGSFLPSLTGTTTSGGAPSLLASTQFQFQDVGVNVTLTPHLLPDGEIALHAKIDISSVQPSVQIAGVEEPTFGQRQIEHDIRLKAGETSVLGGLLQTNNTERASGVPGLARIPGLKYLFSQTHHEKVQTDVLIMLTPRVIRLPGPAVTDTIKEASVQPARSSVPSSPADRPAKATIPQSAQPPAPSSSGEPRQQK